MIKLIVGLGNPGSQYEKTRHNAGFIFLNHLALQNGLVWKSSSQFQSDVISCSINGKDLILIKPLTFMNKSGLSVGKVMRYYKLKPEEMLVVHDELELAEGVIKLKLDGGHAGHNGLRDIIAHLDSRNFYRLRLGIGRPSLGGNVADYVLSKPSQAGSELLDKVCQVLIKDFDWLVDADMAKLNALLPAQI
ncbi:aminoacyl-tRNA hydrolase [Methylomonas sp. AM2-LC]|uniref:aminoacyl-tRNA hydrolase n=1 Tax=Methylomonas sp. AM2-LC TaxID=3153301 RepID=UPI00326317CA